MSITEEERKNERIVTARKENDDIDDEIGDVNISVSQSVNKMHRIGRSNNKIRNVETPKVDASSALDAVTDSNYDDDFESVSASKSMVGRHFGTGG